MFLSSFSKDCLVECTQVLNCSILPEFSVGSERPLDGNDFSNAKIKFETTSKQINSLLDGGIVSDTESAASDLEINRFLVSFIIHNGEHYKLNSWTSPSTFQNCSSSFKLVFPSPSNEHCFSQLVAEQGNLLKNVLGKLRPCLLSESWKMFPTAVHSYVWILKLLPCPYVGDYLDLLLPTSLIITDDFIVSNKILGIGCLQHIIENVTLKELQLRSHEEVIFKTLEMCFHEKDAHLITSLVSCILTLLKKMYLTTDDHCQKWTHYDELMTKYLYQLKLEGSVTIRKSMIDSLPEVIASCGLLTVRYIDKIIEIIDESSVSNETVMSALTVIQEIMVVCTPCLEHHLKQITFIIFKILYSTESCSAIVAKCKEILNNIFLIMPAILQDLTSNYQYGNLNKCVKSIVEEIVANAK